VERGSTNLLAISFSALDKVGHDFGPNSHEIQDVLIRLDRTLGDLFAGLDTLIGAGNYVVALTADHGVAPMPERAVAEHLPAGRVDVTQVRDTIEATFTAAAGAGPHLLGFVHSEAYLSPAAKAALTSSPHLLTDLRASLKRLPGVADVFSSA